MPDISKLPEVADIFQISIDELLGEKAPLVESAIHNELETYIEKTEVTEKEIRDVLPILKPEQTDTIMEKVDVTKFKDI